MICLLVIILANGVYCAYFKKIFEALHDTKSYIKQHDKNVILKTVKKR